MKPQLIFKKIDLAQTPPLMSALGQKQTWQPGGAMSALPQKRALYRPSYIVVQPRTVTANAAYFDVKRPLGNHSSPVVPWRNNRNARSISTLRSSLVGTKV